jgi:hypothetical protein
MEGRVQWQKKHPPGNAGVPPNAAYFLQLRPEEPAVNSPERQLSLLPTGETGGRPEGPTVNNPDRKVGITQLSEMSAEGAALQGMFTPSAAPSVLIVFSILSRPDGRAY